MQVSHSVKSKRPAPVNFLEALRDLGSDLKSEAKIQVKKIVISDLPEAIGLTPASGTLQPNEQISVAQLQQAENQGEKKAEARFQMRLQQIKAEEQSYRQRQETQIRQTIQAIQSEIKSLVKSAGGLAHEVEIAASQAPANPGVYHVTFFHQLKALIVTLRRKVEDSRHWLATTNSRAQKRSYYWGQVGKSGTKYMLSSERYMVTSTG
ncbi:hypothetical protein A2634_04405 [Candidatus Amesbacteria bacterium RIFCSPHIGHO2_01_FULL_48_32]|uniref:DUF5660 domain-containing protein n=1 Tax=Candidatus Amesbacteria bacterium RIFCSPLOWO2_01_FULL_48_25 TaxID=1797259 RepID=A0A1F4ZC38_9BACT|nr:MAG: hypothetical protein A2634_04405 [Candidatus Amesbacteria bacterium RIFCSPHIGHO2_01_FULL_48_32]OGD03791.1 MAG: hypothetical protein A2989_03870 [Candidatus Amesbacteria bacterium RIFCSPLOWO2_01_FULL_48_25]HJZ05102.1 DUF5660 family protein [Patescibacteria group bacterium]